MPGPMPQQRDEMETPADRYETAQRTALRRNRRLATALLICASVIFLATMMRRDPGFWTLLVRASAEAAVVGALADWFAVTAVFRRPLGLPIPHTAIVPRNKDRIGAALGVFVANNFLTPALIGAKLRSLDPAGRLAAWLAMPANAEAATQRVMLALPTAIGALEDQEIREFALRALGEQLRAADLSAVLGRTLAAMTAGEPFDTLVDTRLRFCERKTTRSLPPLRLAAMRALASATCPEPRRLAARMPAASFSVP